MDQYKYFATLIAACLLAPVLAAAQATTPKPITHETLWMMKRVGTPAVSPDGKWRSEERRVGKECLE